MFSSRRNIFTLRDTFSSSRSFADHLRTHYPPPHFDNRDLNHPFYQSIAAYLTQTTKGSLAHNDLRPSFTRIVDSTFSWMPHHDVIDGAIEVAHPAGSEKPFQPLNVYKPHTHLLPPLAHLERPISKQSTAVEESGEASVSGCAEPEKANRYQGRPGLWIIAHCLTLYTGKMVRWQVTSMVAEIQHYPLMSTTRSSSHPTDVAKAKALEAVADAITFLAAAWVQAGTWLGLAMTNSKYSRLCVLEGVKTSTERSVSSLLDATVRWN